MTVFVGIIIDVSCGHLKGCPLFFERKEIVDFFIYLKSTIITMVL